MTDGAGADFVYNKLPGYCLVQKPAQDRTQDSRIRDNRVSHALEDMGVQAEIIHELVSLFCPIRTHLPRHVKPFYPVSIFKSHILNPMYLPGFKGNTTPPAYLHEPCAQKHGKCGEAPPAAPRSRARPENAVSSKPTSGLLRKKCA